MPAATQLDDRTLQQIREILVRHGVTRAGIFGSFARGEADETSDVDLLVEVPRGTTLFGLARLERELASVTKRPVDLVTYAGLHPAIRDEVMREQVGIL